MDALFKLPSLVHAGLSYNTIAALPPPRQLAACTSLLSLDISHNAVEDLPGALAAIAALPSLQVRPPPTPTWMPAAFRAFVACASSQARPDQPSLSPA